MKFKDLEYKRPDIKELQSNLEKLISDFDNAKDAQEQYDLIIKINALKETFESAYSIAHVRHTQNTVDEFYEKEIEYFDQNTPYYEELEQRFALKVANSKFIEELSKLIGQHYINLKVKASKVVSPEILEDLQQENKLTTEYSKTIAQAKVEFQGQTYTLSGIARFFQSSDRDLRKSSNDAYGDYFLNQKDKFDSIFTDLVNVRTSLAKKLNYSNFVQYCYDKIGRTDYTPEDITKFRELVHKLIVPLTKKLYDRQAKRIGVSELTYYDKSYKFNTGNAKPQGNQEWIIENAKQMYKELSNETNEFFNLMLDREFMDLDNRPNKRVGGYCTSFDNIKMPFIFSNFNGTAHDIEVLTHEFGHAFQYYLSKDNQVIEYRWPTYEACEILSMGMEFMTWPWMNLFFKQDTDKFFFTHLSGSVLFLPYGCAVDEFQYECYMNPELTADERAELWKKIDYKYNPYIDNTGSKFLDSGRFWQRQHHIFGVPLYYIDYVLAQICAMELWSISQTDYKKAWDIYMNISKIGGKKPFLEIVKDSGLKSPFEESTIKEVASTIDRWLESFDDSSF